MVGERRGDTEGRGGRGVVVGYVYVQCSLLDVFLSFGVLVCVAKHVFHPVPVRASLFQKTESRFRLKNWVTGICPPCASWD